MKLRRSLSAAAIAVTFSASMAFATSASATPPPPIDGTGTVTCNALAILKFSPALVVGGTTPTTVTFKSVLKNCTGTGDGTHIRLGLSSKTFTMPANDCMAFQNDPLSAVTGNVKWVAVAKTQKLNPSAISFTAGVRNQGPPITIDASGNAASGSFSGATATTHSVLKEDFAKLASKCTSPSGLKVIHIGAGSTFSLT